MTEQADDGGRAQLAGVDNFRDFGGYRGAGGTVRSGLLFRSGHLAGATKEDIACLDALGLSLVVDLRQHGERTRQPSPWREGQIATLVLDETGAGEYAPHESHLERAPSPAQALEVMTSFYRSAPFQPHMVSLYRRAFWAIVDDAGPALIHCAAGKDRTGLLVALIQLALGVHDDDVMADYLATNAATRWDLRMPQLQAAMQRLYGRTFEEETLLLYARVEPAYLQSALDLLHERSGGWRGYLAGTLDVDDAAIETMRRRLIA